MNNKRNPYADVGLIVAIAAFIIMLVKMLIFGISWAAATCFILTIIYFSVSFRYKSDSKTVRNSTTAYLVLLAATVACVVLFDKNTRPKMHAFEGAAVDTLQEEEFLVIDKEVPVEIVENDTTESDSVGAEEFSDTDLEETSEETPVEQIDDQFNQ